MNISGYLEQLFPLILDLVDELIRLHKMEMLDHTQ